MRADRTSERLRQLLEDVHPSPSGLGIPPLNSVEMPRRLPILIGSAVVNLFATVFFIESVFLGTILLSACSPRPTSEQHNDKTPPSSQTSLEETGAAADKNMSNWKTYTNNQAHFSLRYPPRWMVTSMPDDNYQTDHIYGAEGYVDVTWGDGLGGACGENGREKELETMTFNGEQFGVCHTYDTDGGESWSQISKKLGKGLGFTARAYAKPPTAEHRWVILDVLSTLTFGR